MEGHERREGGPGRRQSDLVDWRLGQLEHDVTALTTRVDDHTIATSPGELDRRYVQRVELARGRAESRDWSVRIIGLMLGVGQLALAYAAIRGH